MLAELYVRQIHLSNKKYNVKDCNTYLLSVNTKKKEF